ncbi:MAG: hypothetical protein ABS880_10690, partial [Psychrobacter alimentarius]
PANKGVMSANSTATSKTKTSGSSTNGNGNAPKNKKGGLDPNRLPDSSQDNTASTDVDSPKTSEQKEPEKKDSSNADKR